MFSSLLALSFLIISFVFIVGTLLILSEDVVIKFISKYEKIVELFSSAAFEVLMVYAILIEIILIFI